MMKIEGKTADRMKKFANVGGFTWEQVGKMPTEMASDSFLETQADN